MLHATLRCRCSVVQGTALDISPTTVMRAICYCLDCQAFARFLGSPGILDAHGGTDVFQVPQARVRIDRGADKLACVRLSAKGLMRWYTACCRTPVGNMLPKANSPFITLIQPFMLPTPGRTLDQLLGAPVLRIAQASASSPLLTDLEPRGQLRGYARFVRLVLKSILLRQHKPSPFFTADGTPVVTPEILTPARHEALRVGAVS